MGGTHLFLNSGEFIGTEDEKLIDKKGIKALYESLEFIQQFTQFDLSKSILEQL